MSGYFVANGIILLIAIAFGIWSVKYGPTLDDKSDTKSGQNLL